MRECISSCQFRVPLADETLERGCGVGCPGLAFIFSSFMFGMVREAHRHRAPSEAVRIFAGGNQRRIIAGPNVVPVFPFDVPLKAR